MTKQHNTEASYPVGTRPPDYVIVVDQLHGWFPDAPPSLAEAVETGHTRLREPEADLEAEP